MEDRVARIERRVKALEQDMQVMKTDVAGMKTNTDEILFFVKGMNKVAGIAWKYWKVAIVFGAGIMTSAGIGNPNVWRYISGFFGAN